jgi:hypothetical protein
MMRLHPERTLILLTQGGSNELAIWKADWRMDYGTGLQLAVDKPTYPSTREGQLVSTPRFTPEFKEEAVKQVVDRGYRVPDGSVTY